MKRQNIITNIILFIIFYMGVLFSLPCSICSANNHYSSIGKNSEGYYGQCGQDKYLYENLFKNKKNGIFIEIGAHNGIAYSNTKFFEELGWKGICIEPIPEVFEELKKNRKAICVKGCIADKKGKANFLSVKGPEMLSGLVDKYHPAHMNRVNTEISDPSNKGSKQIIEVDCYLLNDILEENKMFHVDYLSIDTEGNELDILKSIDFKKFDIDVIEVENNFNDDIAKNYLVSKGYSFVKKVGWDDIFRKSR